MIPSGYNERKAAQAAAFFLTRASGSLNVLKLTKLLYLAEREAYRRFGEPMIGDRPVSMPHGPALSITLNLTDGNLESSPKGWDSWVEDRELHKVRLARSIESDEDLDELSEAELQLLADVWREFGGMNQWEIRDWTHQHCQEWDDPDGSSTPIRVVDVLTAVGYSAEQARELCERIDQHACVSRHVQQAA